MPSIFGGFSDPVFITTDKEKEHTDAYIKSEIIPSRYTGANFKIGPPKKGRTKDVYLSKEFLSLASRDQNKGNEVDKFVDPVVLARRQAMESKKKNITDKDFKYASGPKKPSGSGGYYGTFYSKPLPHEEDYKVPPRGEPTPKVTVSQPRNIVTRPARKGTYGVPGTTFSGIEFPQKTDDYDAIRKKEAAEWAKSKEKMITTAVFKNTIRPVRFFDEKNGTGVSSAFDHFDPPEDTGKPKRRPKKPEPKNKLEDRPVFKYSSGRKSGIKGCINPFPNSSDKPDPADAPKTKAKEDKKADPGPKYGLWKPVSGQKSSVVRSLLKTYY